MKLIRNGHRSRRNLGGIAALMVGAMAFAVSSQPALANNLHFTCLDGAACGSAATVTDTTNPPSFDIQWAGNGDKTGDLVLVFLTPQADGTSLSPITITGTGKNGAVSGSASLFSNTPWTSGKLDAFLSTLIVGGANPNNPIGAYADSYVWTADLGTQTLCHQGGSGTAGNCTASDQLDLTTSDLPQDTYILGFLGVTTATTHRGVITYSTTWFATANSESLLELDGPPPPATPEPSSLMLLGTGALGLAGAIRRRFKK